MVVDKYTFLKRKCSNSYSGCITPGNLDDVRWSEVVLQHNNIPVDQKTVKIKVDH